MIFEKLQFTVYECLIRLRFLLFLLILAISAWIFYSVSMWHAFSKTSNVYVEQCLGKLVSLNTPEEGTLMNMSTIVKVAPVYEGAEEQCRIESKQNTTIPYAQSYDLFRDMSLEYLAADVKDKHKINQVVVAMNINNLTSKMVYDYFGVFEVLVAKLQQAMVTHNINQVYLKDRIGDHNPIEIKNTRMNSWIKVAFVKIGVLWLLFGRMLVMSTLTGLIAMSFLIMVSRGMIVVGEVVFRVTGTKILLKWFPFLNDYLEGLRGGRRDYLVKYIVLGYFGISAVVFYGLLYFVSTLMIKSLIGIYYSEGNDLAFIGAVIIEFLSIIILRSRTSIKYTPNIIIKIYLICLFFADMYPYTLPLFFWKLSFQINIIYLLFILITVENSVSKSRQFYRPSKENPRALYFPSYNISWHSGIPPLWTYFVPPHDRSFFNQNQLCYVNGQFQRLYCILMGLPYEAEEAENIRDRPHPLIDEVEMARELL